jgi:hypothetical protein
MRKLILIALAVGACLLADYAAHGQELRLPDRVVANSGATIQTNGSGSSTLYVTGPGLALKKQVTLGQPVSLGADQLRNAGRYLVVLGSGKSARTAALFVVPAQATKLNFLAKPSRVPVARPDVISGVAFIFDDYKNLVTEPARVTFNLAVANAAPVARTVEAHDGIAWAKLPSSAKAGAAQFTASIGGAVPVRRVVQQVASDPCNLRFRAQPAKDGIVVETDPVRDCSGNPVPDGTIVTFIQTDSRGRSTVDARVKRGVARAELPAAPNATITVASGVVLGNELHWGGAR